MDWLQILRWPGERKTTQLPVLRTWVKFPIDFLITTQRSIPTSIRENNITIHQNNGDHEGFDMRAFAYSFIKMVKCFRDSRENIKYLCQMPKLPTTRPKFKSICILGGGHLKQEITYRPMMLLRQKETMDAIFRPDTGKPPSYWNHPRLPNLLVLMFQRLTEPIDNTSAARNRRHNQRRKEIKQSRTG